MARWAESAGPVSSPATLIDESGGWGTYMPNLQWGSGIDGWEEDRIYIPDGWEQRVYEVEIGVPGKPRVYP